MQRIERYGVIALVLLLVTILAVSLWGERKNGGGFLSMFRREKPADLALAQVETPPGDIVVGEQPLARPPIESATTWTSTPPNDSQVGLGSIYPPSPAPDMGGPSPVPYEPVPTDIPQPERDFGRERPPAAPPAGRQPASAGRTYVVQRGESLSLIAQRELGSTQRWPEIQALNGNIAPERVGAGMTLILPAGGAAPIQPRVPESTRKPAPKSPSKSEPAGGRTYVVRNGDSLSAIALRELGSARRWTEIRDLNPGINPDRLVVGKPLVLPAGAPSAATERPQTVATLGWSQPRTAGSSNSPRVR